MKCFCSVLKTQEGIIMTVRAIRGATTVNENSRKDILSSTRELLVQIKEQNNIKEDDIISIFFSLTDDLNAEFPAAAARELGWLEVALMCTKEIEIPGSLEKCIRVMVHINTNKQNFELNHVYLKNAKSLRPDIVKRNGTKKADGADMINIAIDGPAGAGKSTIAKILSKKLGVIYLDTGAMYRAVALKALRENLDTRDSKALEKMMRDINIKIEFENGEQKILLDGKNVSGKIRTKEVTIGSSNVAVVPAVRLKMVEIQRQIASEKSVVMDGRDIGSHVLPHADFKFFLNASLGERARRRYEEQIGKGMPGIIYEEVLKDIEYRDKNDSSRDYAPLVKAEDAIEIDTTNMGIDQVANKILDMVKEKNV